LLSGRRKKANSLLFTAHGKCTIKDCPVTFALRMEQFPTVEVLFKGSVSHNVKEMKSRQIKGTKRHILKEAFRHGEKLLREYLTRLNAKPLDEIVAGKDVSRRIKKISSESKHLYKSSDLLVNVQSLMEELKTADKLSTSAKGFIQAFSVSPMYVLIFTKVAVRIYHDMCKSNVFVFRHCWKCCCKV
jgi:hypothetical protein